MKLALVVAVAGIASAGGAGCSSCGSDQVVDDGGMDGNAYNECEGDPASFVRQTFLALDGRRPKSQAEVDVYVDLYTATKAKMGDPKDAVARAIMAEHEFTERY